MYALTQNETVSIPQARWYQTGIRTICQFYFLAFESELQSVHSVNTLGELTEIEQEDLQFVRSLRPRLAKLFTNNE